MTQTTYEVRPKSFKAGGRKKKIKPPLIITEPRYQVPLIFVTSFSPGGYEDYGRKFLESFIEHWPKDVILAVFHENQRPPIDDVRIWYFNLLEDDEYQEFLAKYAREPKARGIVQKDGQPVRDFRWDAVRFAPKIFALTSPVLPMSSWRCWIDADVETTGKIPDEFFSKLLRDDAVAHYLGRPKQVFGTSECGFVAYHTAKEAGRQFVLDLRLNYTTGKIFGLPEYHDSFVFDVLRRAYEEAGCKFKDIAAEYYKGLRIPEGELNFVMHGHPWPHTALGRFLRHKKGPEGKNNALKHEPRPPQHVNLQRILSDPNIKSRYEQLVRILRVHPHEAIVEIGVALGDRGEAMCRVNLERGKKVTYYGFDLFEDLTPELKERELNAKTVGTHAEVSKRFAKLEEEFAGKFEWLLVKGNTRDTLPGFPWPEDGVDFAFIDGGHSIETIRSDYEALKNHAPLIVFDDYYIAGQDTTKFGCNQIVDSLKPKLMLPVVDKFGDMEIQMVAVGAALHRPGQPMPLKVKTRNSASDDEIQAHIRNAARYDKRGLETLTKELIEEGGDDLAKRLRELVPPVDARFLPGVLRPVETPVLFVGGSPVVSDPQNEQYNHTWAMINELGKTHRIVVCKTSYSHAFRNNVMPWACFLLDPRDHVAQWIDPPDFRVLYLVASMCHPTTWDHVARPGFNILGYHAGVGAQEAPTVMKYFGDAPMVHGGTTSSFRGLALLYNLGFRHFKTIGLDSSYPSKPEKTHGRSVKSPVRVTIGTEVGKPRQFWSDPELIAQAQDAELLYKLHPTLDIEYIGDGALQYTVATHREMTARADTLDKRPIEQRLSLWFTLFRSSQHLAEALYIDDALLAIQNRVTALRNKVKAQPSFDEFVSG